MSLDRRHQLENIEVSAVMPCLNEARTLATCIRKAQQSFAKLGVTGEVVVADNGSTDQSRQIAESLGARVVQEPIKGYGTALMAGIKAARGEIIIIGDADDSYDWSDLGAFVEGIRQGNDLVMGNRFKGGILPGAMPWHHRYIGNPLLSRLSRFVYGVPIGDFHCGMRAFTRTAYELMHPHATGMEFATELVACAARMNLKIAEVPVKLYPDGRNRPSHLRSFRDGWRHLRFILTYAPDHLYLLPGTLLLGSGLFLQCLLARGPLSISDYYFGIHFVALGGLLTLVGFNLIHMGVLAKILVLERFPRMRAKLASWALESFTLEKGLLFGGCLAAIGALVELGILIRWLLNPGEPMEGTVHPAFVAGQAIVLGTNIIFASFVLHLLVGTRAARSPTTAQNAGERPS
ncbi:MAG TPA: glycosyltransferase family 2 protein [Nevskiales bacterium]|nr:glycosyltransferase family 2 protein [Nevskiales bacterium]